jgi:hypothetical protein
VNLGDYRCLSAFKGDEIQNLTKGHNFHKLDKILKILTKVLGLLLRISPRLDFVMYLHY